MISGIVLALMALNDLDVTKRASAKIKNFYLEHWEYIHRLVSTIYTIILLASSGGSPKPNNHRIFKKYVTLLLTKSEEFL